MMTRTLPALLAATLLMACTGANEPDDTAVDTGSDTDTDTDTDTVAADTASVRVLHLSPDAPAVDVYANGAGPVVSGLVFGDGTAYLTVDAGTYDFQIVPAGGALADAVLEIEGLTLAAGTQYSAVAYDVVAELSALALIDDDSGIGSDETRLQLTHAAAGIANVDVWELSGPTLLVDDFAFGATGVLDIATGPVAIGLDLDDDATPDVIFDVPALGAGAFVNVFAVLDDAGPHLLAHLPDGSTARVDPRPAPARLRVLHLSPDAPGVDVFANDGASPAVSGLSFPNGTGYLELAQGTYDFQVSAAGQPASSAVLDIDGLLLDGGVDYTAVAYGNLAGISALALVDDASGIATGEIRLQVSHVADGVGTVDVWAGTTKIIDGFAYGTTTSLDVPGGALTIALDTDRDGTGDASFAVPDLGTGAIVNVFAVLDATGPFLLAQLPDGTTAVVRPLP